MSLVSDLVEVRLGGNAFADWPSFHSASAQLFGFPDYYGRNRDAWLDCMYNLQESSRREIRDAPIMLVRVEEAPCSARAGSEIKRFLLEGCSWVNRELVASRAEGFGQGPLAIAVAMDIR